MVNTNSAESSTWDFTQVHDLLRSPTYGGALRPSRHTEPTAISAQEQQAKTVGNCDDDDTKPHSLTSRSSHTKLGDFSSLWELLNNGPAPVSLTPASVTTEPKLPEIAFDTPNRPVKGIPSVDKPVAASAASVPTDNNIANAKCLNSTKSSHPYHASTSAQPVSILKRVVHEQCSGKTVNVKFDDPRTPTKLVAATEGSSSDTPKRKTNPKNRDSPKRVSTRNEPISSEGSAGVDSDSSAVFDRPFTNRTGALAFIPAQIGTPEVTSDRYDTPPSSFDDQEWSLNTDTIRNGTRVRSTLYKSSTERRVSLMTRLLKEFPGYAKIVSQVGQSVRSPPKQSIGSQPIHIFVDMSNVSIFVMPLSYPTNRIARS